MKRNTQVAELKTQVKHNTLHKMTARGALGRKMVVNRTKKSLRITWVKTTHCTLNLVSIRNVLLISGTHFFLTVINSPHLLSSCTNYQIDSLVVSLNTMANSDLKHWKDLCDLIDH